MKKSLFILLFAFLLVAMGCSPSAESRNTVELTVSAASSMTESLLELKDAFEKENPLVQISYNFGGTGALRKQIEQGAPIDFFFSASKKDYEKLVEEELVQDGTAIFKNKLVLIKSEQAKFDSLNEFVQGDGMIAVGTPEAVPAGTYAKEALQNMEVWDKLQRENRLVLTKDVAQVLVLVSQGAADAGIVYSSDVLQSDDVEVLDQFDTSLHSPIEYFGAIIENGEQNDEVIQARETFYQFILEDTAMEIFERYGFETEK